MAMSSKIFIKYENSLDWQEPVHPIDIKWWNSLGNLAKRRIDMRDYEIRAYVELAPADEAEKIGPTLGVLIFNIKAANFDEAAEQGKLLLPIEEFKLAGVTDVTPE